MLYAVGTAIQLHIAELTEPLRKLYVTAYTLSSTSAYLYRSTAKRLEGIFGDDLPDAEAKDFYEMEIASTGMMRSFVAVPVPDAVADGGAGGEQLGELDDI